MFSLCVGVEGGGGVCVCRGGGGGQLLLMLLHVHVFSDSKGTAELSIDLRLGSCTMVPTELHYRDHIGCTVALQKTCLAFSKARGTLQKQSSTVQGFTLRP